MAINSRKKKNELYYGLSYSKEGKMTNFNRTRSFKFHRKWRQCLYPRSTACLEECLRTKSSNTGGLGL